ncbi:MAG: YqaA family protein [Gammaproteobacteria bacterium]
MEIHDVGLWGLFISAFISSTIAPGGSEAVLAVMVSKETHPVLQLIAVASCGNTLGALTTWGLGVLAAEKYPVDRMLSEKKRKGIKSVKKWGELALLFSWLPIVGDALCFAGGWLKLPFFLSFLAILVGKIVRYVFIAFVFA